MTDAGKPPAAPAIVRAGFGRAEPTRISARLLTVYAVLVAAAGFIPFPVVDELVPQQLVRNMILVTLRAALRTYPVRRVRPLYATGGCLGTLVEVLLYLPLKILLYPIRKVVVVVKAIRGLSQRTASTYLLGHAVARALAAGWLAEERAPEQLLSQAKLVRQAFDTALERVNPIVFSSSIAAVLAGLRGLGLATYRTSLGLLRRAVGLGAAASEPATTHGAVGAAADGVYESLGTPSVAAFFAAFDAAFDAELATLAATVPEAGAPPAGSWVASAPPGGRDEAP